MTQTTFTPITSGPDFPVERWGGGCSAVGSQSTKDEKKQSRQPLNRLGPVGLAEAVQPTICHPT